jgi:hypothetical protein
VPDLQTRSPRNCSESRAERRGKAANRAHHRGETPGICTEQSGVDGRCLIFKHAVLEIAATPVQNEDEKQPTGHTIGVKHRGFVQSSRVWTEGA